MHFTDLPAGKEVRFLVGFTNKGSSDFIIESMDAAFRYPQDYSFYIQNVCTAQACHMHSVYSTFNETSLIMNAS